MEEPLLERSFLEQLERLTLRWQRSFGGQVGGYNLSRFAGPGQEFLEHREFHQGDDLRSANWRAYMRFEKLFLKVFRIEPRVPVRILFDCSLSMTAGSAAGGGTKFDYARKLTAALVYIALVRLDSILIQPFSSSLGEPFVASGGRHRFQPAERYLRRLSPHGHTDLFAVVREFLDRHRQRGLLVVISDFLTGSDSLVPLQYLADFGHEILLLQLWGEEDRTPSGSGELELIDVETEGTRRVYVDDGARRQYTEAFDLYADQLQRLAQRNGGRYAGLSTTTPLNDALFGSLSLVENV